MTKTKYTALSGVMVAVIAICAQIMLPLPFSPVQFSMQTFGVFLTAVLLPPRWSTSALAAYMLLGLMGAPIFGGFRGGPSVLFGVTGGFILVFPIMAFFISYLVARLPATKMMPVFLVMSLSLVICYIWGCLWFSMVTGSSFYQAFILAVVPFIIPDLLKAWAAAALALPIKKAIR